MALTRVPMTPVTQHKPVTVDITATEIGGGTVPLDAVEIAAVVPGAAPSSSSDWHGTDLDGTEATVHLSGADAPAPGDDLVVTARTHLWIKPAAGSYRDAVPVAKVVFP